MHAESFPVDDLARIYQGLTMMGSHARIHPPLPGSGNQIPHNMPSRPLGCHTSADIHLAVGHNGVILCDRDLNAP